MSSRLKCCAGTLFIVAAVLLAGCGSGSRFTELRYDEPSSYFLHVPEGYKTNTDWPLFIALHDFKQDSEECIAEWFDIADENQFFLLCPELIRDGALFDRAANERILADILNQLYQDYELRDRFFLAGKGEAASFATDYAFRYPQAIAGVSAIAAPTYPSGVTASGGFPILVIVDGQNPIAIEAGTAFINRVNSTTTQARLVEIDNLGNRIPYGVQRLTVELFQQFSR